MSFQFPKFSLQALQDSLPTVDQVKESFSKVNPGKTVDNIKESIQPFTSKTTQLISTQLQQVQHLANLNVASNIEISELPADYLELEANCDILLKLYTDLIHFTNETYGKVSYDYPSGNYAITKIKDANVGGLIGDKFNQLRNVSSPQELEKVFLGTAEKESQSEETIKIQTTAAHLPRTLFGQLSVIAQKHSDELKASDNALSLALLQSSSAYHEIAVARLDQDDKITADINHKLVTILNEQFIKVNELRKKVYSTRSEFDVLRAKFDDEEGQENEDLIVKEDELVSATENAVVEMKKLLRPSKNVSLLKVFVQAQRDWFDLSAKKLDGLLTTLEKIEFDEEEDLE